MRCLYVVRSGLMTTLQDAGRFGYQKYGVTVSGTMDPFAARMANLLVGNPDFEAVLEITLVGPTLRFDCDAWIAVCGGSFDARVGGRLLREWQPVRIRGGEALKFGAAREGCRAYLSVAGGFDVPQVMGSKSTTLRAGLGGHEGRALHDGDVLPLGEPSGLPAELKELEGELGGEPFYEAGWSIGMDVRPAYQPNPILRVLPGGEWERFTPESREWFVAMPFRITPQSDRMGCRLSGPRLELSQPQEMLSEAVTFGTIQVTPEGHPILLQADSPVTGGYPKIAQVISVDLPLLAQAKPGEEIRFRLVSLREAQDLYRRREQEIQRVKQGIALHGR